MPRVAVTLGAALSLVVTTLAACGADTQYQGGGRKQPSGAYGLPGADSGIFEGVDGGTDAASGDAASDASLAD